MLLRTVTADVGNINLFKSSFSFGDEGSPNFMVVPDKKHLEVVVKIVVVFPSLKVRSFILYHCKEN